MSMNIKSEAVHRMAAELAKLRGVSMTRVVADALTKELAEEKRRKSRETVAETILEIGRQCKKRLPKELTSKNAFDWMYDENGLPK